MVRCGGADILGAEVRVPGAAAPPAPKDDVYLGPQQASRFWKH
jgi:hypothetical protein